MIRFAGMREWVSSIPLFQGEEIPELRVMRSNNQVDYDNCYLVQGPRKAKRSVLAFALSYLIPSVKRFSASSRIEVPSVVLLEERCSSRGEVKYHFTGISRRGEDRRQVGVWGSQNRPCIEISSSS